MISKRTITRSRWVQKAIGIASAEYLRLVWHTNRMTIEPADAYEQIPQHCPIIIAMWHGQHFLMPFIRTKGERAKVLVSRHRDGELNAVTAEWLGIGTIRGSGTHGTDFATKGGVYAFREIISALEEGYNVAMTADVPKVARVAGLGIVKIAQVSGRPIYPMAIATSRRYQLDNWDRTTVNLPFGRSGGVVGEPILVPQDADDHVLEQARRMVEERLNDATRRAYELADGMTKGSARG
jgi:lysophospholipid acyltransferase (LPLAT)-like uncharacterized protein